MLHYDSDQLELDLFPGVPWHGHAPRDLTRSGSGFIFKPQGVVGDVFADAMQLEIWPVTTTGTERNRVAPVWGGSPSLLPLLEGRTPHGTKARRIREED